MKPRLIGIVSSTRTDLMRMIAVKLMLEHSYMVRSYDDAADGFIASVLGCSAAQLKDENFSSSYLGEQWSYIREERFVEGGSISRKPVKYFLSPRNIVQKFKLALRNIHANFLVNALFIDYEPGVSSWVIPGLQFPNEMDAIRERGGMIIHLEKSNLVVEGDKVYDRASIADVEEIVKFISKL